MRQCYTSQRCANRGPHKVNTRSYVAPYHLPVYKPEVVPSRSLSSSSLERVTPSSFFQRFFAVIAKFFRLLRSRLCEVFV